MFKRLTEKPNEEIASESVGLGIKHQYRGNFDKAIADYNRAITIAPNYPHAYRDRASSHKAIGNAAQAARAMQMYRVSSVSKSPAWALRWRPHP